MKVVESGMYLYINLKFISCLDIYSSALLKPWFWIETQFEERFWDGYSGTEMLIDPHQKLITFF